MSKDLFEYPEQQPEELKAILETVDFEDITYEELAEVLKKVHAIGFHFDYQLDAVAYSLRPISVIVEEL